MDAIFLLSLSIEGCLYLFALVANTVGQVAADLLVLRVHRAIAQQRVTLVDRTVESRRRHLNIRRIPDLRGSGGLVLGFTPPGVR
jgi:hypothetical protein